MRRLTGIIGVVVVICASGGLVTTPALADEVHVRTLSSYFGVGASVTAESYAGGSPGSLDADGQPTAECKNGAKTVLCWNAKGHWWSSKHKLYCYVEDQPVDTYAKQGHLDAQGKPTGFYIACEVLGGTKIWGGLWQADRLVTPVMPGSDPSVLVRTAIAELRLRAPVTQVGAFVYPEHRQYGPMWWVGSPMWFWVDADDDRQWGSHVLPAGGKDVGVEAEQFFPARVVKLQPITQNNSLTINLMVREGDASRVLGYASANRIAIVLTPRGG